MISEDFLNENYVLMKRSARDIAVELSCSENKVTYWLQKYNITKRNISDALYQKHNPNGDPFCFKKPQVDSDWFLYGLGLGLFWGEGNKVNKHSVRLGNTDPALIKVFLIFLNDIFQIDQSKLRFGLQIFSDTDPETARNFWMKKLKINPKQFQKIIVTPSTKLGTYTKKNQNGVLTIYFSNIKLRDSIVSAIEALQTTTYANVAQMVERIHGKS